MRVPVHIGLLFLGKVCDASMRFSVVPGISEGWAVS